MPTLGLGSTPWGSWERDGLWGWGLGPFPALPPVLTLLFQVVGRGHSSSIINMII